MFVGERMPRQVCVFFQSCRSQIHIDQRKLSSSKRNLLHLGRWEPENVIAQSVTRNLKVFVQRLGKVPSALRRSVGTIYLGEGLQHDQQDEQARGFSATGGANGSFEEINDR